MKRMIQLDMFQNLLDISSAVKKLVSFSSPVLDRVNSFALRLNSLTDLIKESIFRDQQLDLFGYSNV